MTNPNKDGVPEGAIEAAADAIWFNLCGDIRQSKIDKLVYRDAAGAALAAALPFLVQPQAGIGVKALEWVERSGLAGIYDASSAVGNYRVDDAFQTLSSSGMKFVLPSWRSPFDASGCECVSTEAAKAAAQADYEARINSALSQPLPSPQGEAAPRIDYKAWAIAVKTEHDGSPLWVSLADNNMGPLGAEALLKAYLVALRSEPLQTKEPGNDPKL